jgi:hypothetical protein
MIREQAKKLDRFRKKITRNFYVNFFVALVGGETLAPNRHRLFFDRDAASRNFRGAMIGTDAEQTRTNS